MNHSLKTRVIALLLSVLMLVGMLPMNVFAEETDVTPSEQTAEVTSETTAAANEEDTDSETDLVTYTVTFDANGGAETASQTVAKGALVVRPADPVLEGYTFQGWYNGETEWNFETDVVSSDLTLTAKWQAAETESSTEATQATETDPSEPEVVTFTVTFDTAGGSAVEAQTVVSGETAVQPEDPTYEGYAFQGWRSGEETWSFETAVTADITLTAVWAEVPVVVDVVEYTVTFNANGGTGTMESQTLAQGTLAENTFVRDTFEFVGWNTEAKGTGTAYEDCEEVTLTADITLYAQWKDVYYSVVSEKNWDIAPGITETELVLNNDAGNQRQVLHIMEADMSNPYTKVTTSYTNMDTSNYAVSNMLVQANWVRDNWGWNVVGAMNSCLSWYNSSVYAEDPSRVNEPLGFMMIDSEIYFDHSVGFPTVLVIHKDTNEAGEARPANIPKVQMRNVKSTSDLNGWEDQVIPVSSGFIVEDGVNKYTPSHTGGAPRSVVGIKPDGTVVIMMNDGRQDPYSIGMNMYELAEVMISLGCSYAVNCDGGGSSTFLSQRPGTTGLAVNCSPSDGALRENTSGVLIISTAPSDGAFSSAYISSEYDYYVPNSVVELDVAGRDYSGAAAEIPAEAVWDLSDDSFGTVTNGVFTSTGKTGTVDVQLVYEGEVVGSKTLNIVTPDEVAFAQAATVIPYGKTISLDIEASYGVFDVGFTSDSFTWEVSNENAGVRDDMTYTATTNESISGVVISATYKYADLGTTTLTITFGKGSEVMWDFEDGDISNWLGQEQVREWLAENSIAESGLFSGGNYSEDNSTRTFLSSVENGGQVKNGKYALGLEVDYRYSRFSEWSYTVLFNVEGQTVLRDVANGMNATKLGMWVYIPEGLVVGKDLKGLAMQYQLYGGTSANDVAAFGGHLVTASGKNLASLTDEDIPEDRWVYFYIDLTSKDYVSLQNPEKQIWREPSFIRFYTQHYTPKSMVFYFDDLTLDYSDAVDDRDPPVISDAMVNTEGTNRRTFNATVADYVATNASGLNYSSAKIYVDGVALSGVSASGSTISGSAVEIPNGTHTVTFEISDNVGNTTKESVSFTVSGTAPVTLGGHNDLNNAPEYDSVYFVDINVAEIEKIDSITAEIDLNTAHLWEIEGMTAAEGFTAKASVNSYSNIVTVTVTKTGDCALTGAQTLVSIPSRVWSWRDTSVYTAEGIFATGLCPVVPYDAKVVRGSVTFAEGAYDGYVGAFGGSISVTTNLDDNKVVWHVHTVEALEDKAATCGESGYTGRTYCHACGSVIGWGTIQPATGHTYALTEDGLVKCHCGVLLTGTLNGVEYVKGVVKSGWDGNSYYKDGVKLTGVQKVPAPGVTDEFYYDFGTDGVCVNQSKFTGIFQDGELYRYSYLGVLTSGWQMIDDEWYYFSSSTMAAVSGNVKVNGVYFDFEENGKLTSGVWVNAFKGYKYCYGPSYYQKEWQEIDGQWYYFQDFYRLTGYYKVKVFGSPTNFKWHYFDENGVSQGLANGMAVDNEGKLRYFENGISVAGLRKVDTDYYFFNYEGDVIRDRVYNVWETHCDLPEGNYAFGADGKLVNGIIEKEDGTYYYTLGQTGKTVGLIQIGDDYYFVDYDGKCATGSVYAWKTNCDLPTDTYEFGEDGRMLNGIVEKDDGVYYYTFGKVGAVVGLTQINDDYYFVEYSGKCATGAKHAWKTNCDLPIGHYEFGEDGKMLDSIVEREDGIYYYTKGHANKNSKTVGMTKVGDDYYFVDYDGKCFTGKVYVWATNCELPEGNYEFASNGKLLNGIVEKEDGIYYYTLGKVGKTVGLTQIDDDYYFVEYSGKCATGMKYAWKTNCDLPCADYLFAQDGKLLNGIVELDDGVYYYTYGKVGKTVGLTQVGEDYYFVDYSGKCATGKKYAWATNCELPMGNYEFAADGKMLNGIVEKDDGVYCYVQGNLGKTAGLTKADDSYYFVDYDGKCATGKTYVWATTCDLPVGHYEFGEDGKALDGFVTKDGEQYYYENGKTGTVGINYINGYYYFVDYGGKLIVNRSFYVWQGNGILAEQTYTFNEQGQIIG